MRRCAILFVSLMLLGQVIAADNVSDLILKAESGNAEAQFRLVKYYGQGLGIPKDPDKAKYWFMKAADNGHIEAQYWTGYNYLYGKGVKSDLGMALQWYERSAKQGYGPAQYMAGYLYQMGYLLGDMSLRPDLKKAVSLYQLAVEQDEVGAQFHLGCFKYFGIGIAKNVAEAEMLIGKASGKGHAVANQFMQGKGKASEKRLQIICEIYPEIYSSSVHLNSDRQ